MLLEIRDIKQNSFKVVVKLSDTILQVKEKIKSKIEIIDIDDQKLVYSGNILADDKTVEECEIDKGDYVTLIYSSTQMEEISKMMASVRDDSQSEVSRDSGLMSQYDTSKSFEAESTNTSTEDHTSDVDQIINTFNDPELDDVALIKSIPDIQNLYKVIIDDPMALPKHLSKMLRQRPLVFEKILENQHAFIDLLNADEYSSADNGLKKVETKDHEAIDRLVKKGYEKEIAMQVYQACNFNESGAAELLNYLH